MKKSEENLKNILKGPIYTLWDFQTKGETKDKNTYSKKKIMAEKFPNLKKEMGIQI